LVLLQARLTSGSLINMQHKRTTEEQECSVVFLGPVRGNKLNRPRIFRAPPQFWRVAFPPEDWSPKGPEARNISRKKSFVLIAFPPNT